MRRRIGIAAGLLASGAAVLPLGAAAWLFLTAPARPLPAFDAVRAAHRPSEARLLDRHGRLLHEMRIDPSVRTLPWTALDGVSPALVRAVVASEDRRFFRHRGVDPLALAGAAADTLRGSRRGASTITMQLVSLLDGRTRGGRGGRSLRRKVLQAREALNLERAWSKREILEAYLNLAGFRGELTGIGAASAGLFGKDPSGLDEADAAVLAALLRSPNAAEGNVERRAVRLARRLGSALPDADVAARVRTALARPYRIAPAAELAPHVARLLLRSGRAQARSTLDADLQRFAALALERQIRSLKGKNVGDGAALVAANRTGEVLAYVGNAGVLGEARHVDGVAAPRQAGSILKPFLYGLALDRRILTAASLLEDTPLDVPTGRGVYAPRNYDRAFRGSVSVRTALASSLNVPAVRTLLLLPEDAFAATLRRAGFSGVRGGEMYGPSLALGTADVTLLELVNAYRTLANGGRWSPLVLEPGGRGGAARRVLSREAAFVVADILADRGAREATFGLESTLSTPFRAAVKTGTSKDMRDNWCVGFTRDYTVGVWVGNLPGDPMWNVSGLSGAAPVWADIAGYLGRRRPDPPPSPPPGVTARRVSFPGGIEDDRTEWFIAGTEPAGPAMAHAPGVPPAIRFPSPGMVVALDPDIPPDRQLLFFEARDGSARHAFVLDGEAVGGSFAPVPWRPVPGSHVLSLVDEGGEVLDTVAFSVRGGLAPAP